MERNAAIQLNLTDPTRTANVCKALSSEARIQILNHLNYGAANLSDLAAQLSIPLSTMTAHIRCLEDAGLISVTPQPGSRGTQKRCCIASDLVTIEIMREVIPPYSAPPLLMRQEMPIGNYFDYKITAPCGMAGRDDYTIPYDDPAAFASPRRFDAQLLWLTTGFLEYRFYLDPREVNPANVERIEFLLEICSETYNFNEEWRSDVTVSINRQEIGIIECPGDHGGRRGRLTPAWWSDNATQFGDLCHITITRKDCAINSTTNNRHNLATLGFDKGNHISLTLGVKPDARYAGGMNLFGSLFGDYSHALVMHVYGHGQIENS